MKRLPMKPIHVACMIFVLSAAALLAQSNPVPLINNPLVPDAVAPGGASFTLTVNGTGFVSSSVVNWNGVALATTFVSGSQLTATVPAASIATASTASVTVTSTGVASNTVFFQVAQPASAVAFTPRTFATGDYPIYAIAADFNGDDKLDVSTVNQGANDDAGFQPRQAHQYISVLLGKGDGTFERHVDYKKGIGDGLMVAADFNNDGKLDLAAANNGDFSVSILLGNGDGTFQNPIHYPAGFESDGLVTADVNKDGNLDLVVGNLNTVRGSVLLGNGDGTFQPAIDYDKGTICGISTVGDFNRDGNLDLAAGNCEGSDIVVNLGNGDGTFQPPVSYPVGQVLGSVATADFNGDGKLDLAVVNYADEYVVSVLLGNGDGTFQSHVDYAAGMFPGWIAMGDFNADGKLDLAFTNWSSFEVGVISVMLGNGDGTFQPFVNFSAGFDVSSVAVGDFDGNGMLDLVDPPFNDTVTVLLQTTASLSSTSLDFGRQKVGTTSPPQTVTLSNIGNTRLTIGSIAVGGMDAADFNQTNNCTTLSPGASCLINVSFAPTTEGIRSALVNITDDASASPQTITLKGSAK
jgi:hypothetical protein